MAAITIFLVTYMVQLAFLFVVYSFTSWLVRLWMWKKELSFQRPDIQLIITFPFLLSFGIIGVITNLEITYENENTFVLAALIVTCIVALAKSVLTANTTTKTIDFYLINVIYYTQPITYYILIFNCPWDLMF